MAISSGTIWEANASATASMVNGGGFNTGNTNFPTDLTTDAATGDTASPVLSSASYNFVAGDVNAWVYVKSGTNWNAGFYQITSVASNKATVNATIGQAVIYNATLNRWIPSTVIGVATVGTPTGGTFGIDYSQSTAAISTNTDLASSNGTTNPSTITSAGSPFGINHTGNIIRVRAGTSWTVGWYEIVSVSGSTATLDRAVGSAASLSSGTFNLGGALSFNSTLDDDFFEQVVGGNFVYFKNGSFLTGETIAVAASYSSMTFSIGYNSVRGDNPSPFVNSTTAPTFSVGNNATTMGLMAFENFVIPGTPTTTFAMGGGAYIKNCKLTNTSTAANRSAIATGTSSVIISCEGVSQNGTAFNLNGTDSAAFGCVAHDSTTGFTAGSTRIRVTDCIAIACRTNGINAASAVPHFYGNTVYGYSGTPRGTGINASSVQFFAISNLVAYSATGLNNATNIASVYSDYNMLYGNTTQSSNVPLRENNQTAVNPSFSAITELTGSTATISTTTLTQTGAFSTVTDNQDYIQVHSGTGATVGVYLITSHTDDTVTVNNSIGTNATADKVWTITKIDTANLGIASGAKGLGFPYAEAFPGTTTTSYNDTGAAQRQESGGGGSGIVKMVGDGGGFVS